MKIIGIGGGSGSGKSAVSYALVDSNPDKYEVINLDDYQKYESEPNLPMLHGVINWDHPDIIRWDDLISDAYKLRRGEVVKIMVWAHRSNVDFHKTGKMIPRIIKSKPVLVVEGYLALYNPELTKLFDRAYYFELDTETRSKRRDKNDLVESEDYEAKILGPMHAQFVEPTKHHADLIINVHGKSVQEVQKIIEQDLLGLL